MADRSIYHPRGIVENVIVQVNDFYFLANFVGLDTKEDVNIPLILGRPFIATGDALIDLRKGELTLQVNDQKITFSIADSLKRHKSEFFQLIN